LHAIAFLHSVHVNALIAYAEIVSDVSVHVAAHHQVVWQALQWVEDILWVEASVQDKISRN